MFSFHSVGRLLDKKSDQYISDQQSYAKLFDEILYLYYFASAGGWPSHLVNITHQRFVRPDQS